MPSPRDQQQETFHMVLEGNKDMEFKFRYDKQNDHRVLLHHGHFGQVFSALEVTTKKPIAVEEYRIDRGCYDHINRHRDLLPVSLVHPNILLCLGYVFIEDCLHVFYDAMEGVSMRTLAEYSRQHPFIDDYAGLRAAVLQIINGLEFLHGSNIIHRDIQGANIIVTASDKMNLKLTNFGLSCKIKRYYQEDFPIETISYKAPEVRADEYTVKADMWSLGCTVIEMIQGKPPRGSLQVDSETKGLTYQPIRVRSRPTVPPGLTGSLEDFILRCLDNDPSTRASARDVKKHRFIQSGEEKEVKDPFAPFSPPFAATQGNTRNFQANTEELKKIREEIGEQDAFGKARHGSQGLASLTRIKNFNSLDAGDLMTWCELVYAQLLKPKPADKMWMQSVSSILSKLIPVVQQAQGDERFCISLCGLFTLCHSLLYIGTMLDSVDRSEGREFAQEIGPCVEKLKFISENRKSKSCGSAEWFYACVAETLEKYFHCLSSDHIWKDHSKRSSFFGLKKKFPVRDVFKDLNSYCEETKHTEELDLVMRIRGLKSPFDRMLCILFAGIHAVNRDRALRLFQMLVRRNADSLVTDMWISMSVVQMFVWILQRTNDPERCKVILRDPLSLDKDTHMGLLEVLSVLKQKSLYYQDTLCLCVSLLYHECPKVSTEMEKLLTDESVRWVIVQGQEKYLTDIFRTVRLEVHEDKEESSVECFRYVGTFGGKIPVDVHVYPNKSSGDVEDREAYMEQQAPQFQTEALLQLSTESHPNICQLLAYQQIENPIFYLLESLENRQKLGSFLTQRRKLPSWLDVHELCKHIAVPVNKAVAHCHKLGIILRNLTANSFYLVEKEEKVFNVKLFLFDMASLPFAGEDGRLITRGTENDPIPLLYSAPESLITAEYSTESDAYMLGHTLIEILTTGCQPYQNRTGYSAEEIALEVLLNKGTPDRPRCIPEDLFIHLDHCFHYDPMDRITVPELLEKLKTFAKGSLRRTVNLHRGRQPSLKDVLNDNVMNGIPVTLRNITAIIKKIKFSRHQRIAKGAALPLKILEYPMPDSDEPPCPDEPQTFSGEFCKVPVFTTLGDAHVKKLLSVKHKNLTRTAVEQEQGPGTSLTFGPLPQTTLFHYARSIVPQDGNIDDILPIYQQIADAMTYLHSCDVIHCNLRTDYVYVSPQEKKAVIGHLGRSQVLWADTEETLVPAFHHNEAYRLSAARWQPYEVNKDGLYSKRSDVASFGFLILESLRVYFSKTNFILDQQAFWQPYSHLAAAQVCQHQALDLRLELPPGSPDWLKVLAGVCMVKNPLMRPKFKDIQKCLCSRRPESNRIITEGRAKLKHTSRKHNFQLKPEDFEMDARELEEKLRMHFPMNHLTHELSQYLDTFSTYYELNEEAMVYQKRPYLTILPPPSHYENVGKQEKTEPTVPPRPAKPKKMP